MDGRAQRHPIVWLEACRAPLARDGLHPRARCALTPRGRDEDRLSFPMAWVRPHDRYEPESATKAVAPSGTYHRSKEPTA